MFARAISRSARLSTRPTLLRRGGGHGTPQWNEPGGYLFNEKVHFNRLLQQF